MRILIGCMLLLLAIGLEAQKHDYIWKSGHYSYLSGTITGGFDIDFNSTPPDTTYVFREIDYGFNSASICDERGDFLFSSNGCFITGHDDIVLMHGDSLNPGYYFNEFCDTIHSTTDYPTLQDIFFLPHPSDTNQYYLIHVGLGYAAFIPSGINKHIYYTLVDKTLDGGHGDVVEKNRIIIEDTISLSSLAAVRHGNGEDWWITTTEYATDNYIFLRLTADTVYESHRQWIGDLTLEDGANGQNNFSPDGNWFARFGRDNGLALYRFNRCEGSFHTPLYDVTPTAVDSSINTGGVAFSENSRMLYMVTNLWIYQYDLWAEDIIGSKTRVATWDGTLIPPSNVGGLFYLPQLAPDGRIFISAINSIPYFHVIEKPNEKGMACEVNQLGFPVPTRNGFVTPYFPNYRLEALGPGGCDSLPTSTNDRVVLEKYGMLIYPNPASTQVEIHFQRSVRQGDKLMLFDLYGRELLHQAAEQKQIDVSNLPAGIYLLQWRRGAQLLATEKLIRVAN